MSLQADIDIVIQKFLEQTPENVVQDLMGSIERLVEKGVGANAIRTGDKAPDFALPNAVGETVALSDLLSKGPLVLSFYRGSWCPFCSLQLRAWQKALPELMARGSRLAVVSPMTPDNSLSTKEKNELDFEVLSDAGNAAARDFGLVFELEDAVRAHYETFGYDLTAFNGDRSWELPIPATYVIAPDGTVVWSFVNTNYLKRAEPAEAIAALDSIKRAA